MLVSDGFGGEAHQNFCKQTHDTKRNGVGQELRLFSKTGDGKKHTYTPTVNILGQRDVKISGAVCPVRHVSMCKEINYQAQNPHRKSFSLGFRESFLLTQHFKARRTPII